MGTAKRLYTRQDIIELFNSDQPHIDQLLADALNAHADVAEIMKREISKMEDTQSDIALAAYEASGEAERDRRVDAYELQHDGY